MYPKTPMKLIHLIAAARPNFMKIAPLFHALKKEGWAKPEIVHTGQHYDLNMSDAFFKDLDLPEPHIHLGIGSGSHAVQTGKIMIAYERILLERKPDLVVVVGDVNSTPACALAASKVQYPGSSKDAEAHDPALCRTNEAEFTRDPSRPLIAHLEAGLRSFDRSMPEEINRLVTDALSDILWTPSPDADENLKREGVPIGKIHRVGNIMIDSLEMMRGRIEAQSVCGELGLKKGEFGVVTIHRPSNVDARKPLEQIFSALERISEKIPLVLPLHPRTRKRMEEFGFLNERGKTRLTLIEPLSYIRFMNLVFHCRLVITDSGGIQEESTYLGIPCLTMRPNTERPITLLQGTNQLCKPQNLEEHVEKVLSGQIRGRRIPELWDGRTASRVVQSIRGFLSDC